MKCLIVLTFLFCTVFASLTQDSQQWEEFKSKYGKIYRNIQEEKLRYSIFQQKLREIEEHNAKYEAGETSYTKGVNQFADMTKDEFRSTLSNQSRGFTDLNITSVYERPLGVKVPDSMDWRKSGAVSDVKSQGLCGACWSFAAAGTLESFNYINTKKMVLFSEQELIDCVVGDDCDGGNQGWALQYVVYFGIQTAQTYPYKEKKGSCNYNKTAVALKIKGYVQIKKGDEEALRTAVGTLGPVAVGLDANEIGDYTKGVFKSATCSKDITNHAALAVGYGRDAQTGEDYWLIKNSWGKDWGENGYIRLKRGNNECAVAVDNVYPQLK